MSSSDAQKKCYELLPKVSRSFALAIEALPEPVRGYICVAYLLCRVVDTIEDHPTLKDKKSAYSQFNEALSSPQKVFKEGLGILKNLNPPQSWDAELMTDVESVIAFYSTFPEVILGILIKNISEMSEGMRSYTDRGDQTKIVLKDNADLDRYCYYVAGTVGNLLTEIFAVSAGIQDVKWLQRQKKRGYHFALGLQKVNMIKDVVADLERGSVFVPETWLEQFKINVEELAKGGDQQNLKKMLLFFVTQAAQHLEKARDYIINLPKDPVGFRLFCIWPYVMALDTLNLGLNKSELFTKNHEIKVSRKKMYAMMKLTKVLCRSDFFLKFYFNKKINALLLEA